MHKNGHVILSQKKRQICYFLQKRIEAAQQEPGATHITYVVLEEKWVFRLSFTVNRVATFGLYSLLSEKGRWNLDKKIFIYNERLEELQPVSSRRSGSEVLDLFERATLLKFLIYLA